MTLVIFSGIEVIIQIFYIMSTLSELTDEFQIFQIVQMSGGIMMQVGLFFLIVFHLHCSAIQFTLHRKLLLIPILVLMFIGLVINIVWIGITRKEAYAESYNLSILFLGIESLVYVQGTMISYQLYGRTLVSSRVQLYASTNIETEKDQIQRTPRKQTNIIR